MFEPPLKVERTRIGHYALIQRLDCTLSEEVYLAESSHPQDASRLFAIKHARRERKDYERLDHAFHQSAEKDSLFHHPNISAFVELIEDEGGLYLVLEHVRGTNLAAVNEVLRAKASALSFDLAAFIALEVLAGLHHVHSAVGPDGKRLGMVLKNLTPATILISDIGEIKVANATLARVLLKPRRPRHPAERFEHAPIEWIAGEPIVPSSNVYTLGVILFELLLGRACFFGRTVEEVLSQISSRGVRPIELERAGVPEPLCEIVQRATYLVPEHRYASALDMGLAVSAWLKGQGRRDLRPALCRFLATHGLIEQTRLPSPKTPQVDAVPRDGIEESGSADTFGLRKPLGRSTTIPRR